MRPIFLILVDSKVKFTKEVTTLGEWPKMRAQGILGPPRFPCSGLPVLRVESEGQKGFVLGETTAILAFLDECLQQAGNGEYLNPWGRYRHLI